MREPRRFSTDFFGMACVLLGPPLGLFEIWFLPMPRALLEWEHYSAYFSVLPFAFLLGIIPACLFYVAYRVAAAKLPARLTASVPGRVLLGAALGAICSSPLLFGGDFTAMFALPPGAFAGAVCAGGFGGLDEKRAAPAV